LELETQIILANRLGYVSADRTENLTKIVEETARMLNALMNTIKAA
jgi:four helix bundle protein